jgi:very-short-patch-repair endonuclease
MKSSSSQSLHRSLKLRGHAAGMRQLGNLPEQLLWARLRGGQLGVWFRRQVVLLGSCIVDFYCPSAKVVVEVDGAYHVEPTQSRADARRDRKARQSWVPHRTRFRGAGARGRRGGASAREGAHQRCW